MKYCNTFVLDTKTLLPSGRFPIKEKITYSVYSVDGKTTEVKSFDTGLSANFEEFELIKNPESSEWKMLLEKHNAVYEGTYIGIPMQPIQKFLPPFNPVFIVE